MKLVSATTGLLYTSDLQEDVICEFEIGCAMDVTGYSLEEAKEMVNLGERAGSVLSVEQTSLINGNFPQNVRGETYGTALMAAVVGEMPDLQAALGTNDQEGYVRTCLLYTSHIIFVFWRFFLIQSSPLLSVTKCSGDKSFTSLNAKPVKMQKTKTDVYKRQCMVYFLAFRLDRK